MPGVQRHAELHGCDSTETGSGMLYRKRSRCISPARALRSQFPGELTVWTAWGKCWCSCSFWSRELTPARKNTHRFKHTQNLIAVIDQSLVTMINMYICRYINMLHNSPNGRHRLSYDTPLSLLSLTQRIQEPHSSPLSSADNKHAWRHHRMALQWTRQSSALCKHDGHHQLRRNRETKHAWPKYKYRFRIMLMGKERSCSIYLVQMQDERRKKRSVLKQSVPQQQQHGCDTIRQRRSGRSDGKTPGSERISELYCGYIGFGKNM